MTLEDAPTSGFAARMAFAREKDPGEDVSRARVKRQIVRLTLAWLVSVPVLLTYGLIGTRSGTGVFGLTAVLTLVLPFACSVIATRHQRMGIGVVYLLLTLLMIVPAVLIIRLA